MVFHQQPMRGTRLTWRLETGGLKTGMRTSERELHDTRHHVDVPDVLYNLHACSLRSLESGTKTLVLMHDHIVGLVYVEEEGAKTIPGWGWDRKHLAISKVGW